MIQYRSLKAMFDGHLREAQNNNRSFAEGRLAGIRDFHNILGLETDDYGSPLIPRGDDGLPTLRPNRAKFSDFSLRTLAESIMGHEAVEEFYHPSNGFDFRRWRVAEAAVDPTAFVNINTYNQTVSGLINAEIMERFNNPEFIVRKLFTIKPTKMNGQKLIAVARMGSPDFNSKRRQPGEQHAEIGLRDAYQTTPETVEQALKCKLTKESVFFDLTGQVEEEAGQVGHILGYQMEQDGADTVLGVTTAGSMALAAQYNRNGTTYATYQSSTPFINDQSNGIVLGSFDATNIDKARQLFVGMTDPESGLEIQVNGKDILVFPGNELLMRNTVYQAAMQLGTQLNSNFPAAWTKTPGGYMDQAQEPWKGPYNVMTLSSIWFNRATAASGLALSASNAKQYWWIGDFQKAFWIMENYPFTPWTAAADEYVMKDAGLIAVFGANYRNAYYVKEPRYSVRNKN